VERSHDAVAATHSDDRHPGRIASDERARLGQCRRRTERSVRTAQHPLHFRIEALLRAIVLDRLAPQLLAGIRAAIGDVREDSLGDLVIVE
jgi:hypothetical protein